MSRTVSEEPEPGARTTPTTSERNVATGKKTIPMKKVAPPPAAMTRWLKSRIGTSGFSVRSSQIDEGDDQSTPPSPNRPSARESVHAHPLSAI